MTQPKRSCAGVFASQSDLLGKRLFSHNSPHFVDVGQRVEVLIVMVIERAFQRHLKDSIMFLDESEKPRQPEFKTIHL